MSENVLDTLRCDPQELRQAMSIHTRKISDACRDKDCIEDLRVYLTTGSQALLDTTANARVRCAQLLYAQIDVEQVAFDRSHYCIDVTFYYRVLADAVVGVSRPATLYGLAVFSKRAVLCSGESSAHVYTSAAPLNGSQTLPRTDLPTAVVEVLDPMVLGSKVREVCDCTGSDTLTQVPDLIRSQFDEELVLSGDRRRLFVTLGQFSIIRLERDAQLVVPVMDYAIPCKECCDSSGSGEDPCEMFSRIPFPAARFSSVSCEESTESDTGYQTC